MARGKDSPDTYVMQVRDNTRRYVQDLLRENERLNEVTISLEGERLDLERQLLDTQSRIGS